MDRFYQNCGWKICWLFLLKLPLNDKRKNIEKWIYVKVFLRCAKKHLAFLCYKPDRETHKRPILLFIYTGSTYNLNFFDQFCSLRMTQQAALCLPVLLKPCTFSQPWYVKSYEGIVAVISLNCANWMSFILPVVKECTMFFPPWTLWRKNGGGMWCTYKQLEPGIFIAISFHRCLRNVAFRVDFSCCVRNNCKGGVFEP